LTEDPTVPPLTPTQDRAAAAPTSLCCAPAGVVVCVQQVLGDDALGERVRAAGLWAGTAVQQIGAAPFGDPLLFRLHGYRLALRRDEAARVLVTVPNTVSGQPA
jgi:Fe2+ transport system protein FeoA